MEWKLEHPKSAGRSAMLSNHFVSVTFGRRSLYLYFSSIHVLTFWHYISNWDVISVVSLFVVNLLRVSLWYYTVNSAFSFILKENNFQSLKIELNCRDQFFLHNKTTLKKSYKKKWIIFGMQFVSLLFFLHQWKLHKTYAHLL